MRVLGTMLGLLTVALAMTMLLQAVWYMPGVNPALEWGVLLTSSLLLLGGGLALRWADR